jgi:hypothetical protein
VLVYFINCAGTSDCWPALVPCCCLRLRHYAVTPASFLAALLQCACCACPPNLQQQQQQQQRYWYHRCYKIWMCVPRARHRCHPNSMSFGLRRPLCCCRALRPSLSLCSGRRAQTSCSRLHRASAHKQTWLEVMVGYHGAPHAPGAKLHGHVANPVASRSVTSLGLPVAAAAAAAARSPSSSSSHGRTMRE